MWRKEGVEYRARVPCFVEDDGQSFAVGFLQFKTGARFPEISGLLPGGFSHAGASERTGRDEGYQ